MRFLSIHFVFPECSGYDHLRHRYDTPNIWGSLLRDDPVNVDSFLMYVGEAETI